MDYRLTRVCKDCGNTDYFNLTKTEAAFKLYDWARFFYSPCANCGSTTCQSLSNPLVPIDQEILDMWGNDRELRFLDQDEELMLAEFEYLPMLLNAIDDSSYMGAKIDILIEAICILLYDNTSGSEEYSDSENVDRERIARQIRQELIKRKQIIIESQAYMRDYVKEVVYPQIGIEVNGQSST